MESIERNGKKILILDRFPKPNFAKEASEKTEKVLAPNSEVNVPIDELLRNQKVAVKDLTIDELFKIEKTN